MPCDNPETKDSENKSSNPRPGLYIKALHSLQGFTGYYFCFESQLFNVTLSRGPTTTHIQPSTLKKPPAALNLIENPA